jgi:hypothetical protein
MKGNEMDGALQAHQCDVPYAIQERSRFPRNMSCNHKEGGRQLMRKLTTGCHVRDECDEPSRHKHRNFKTLDVLMMSESMVLLEVLSSGNSSLLLDRCRFPSAGTPTILTEIVRVSHSSTSQIPDVLLLNYSTRV